MADSINIRILILGFSLLVVAVAIVLAQVVLFNAGGGEAASAMPLKCHIGFAPSALTTNIVIHQSGS